MNLAMISKISTLINTGMKFDILHLHDWLVAYAGKGINNIWPDIAIVSTLHATESGRNFGIHNDVQEYISNVERMLPEFSRRIIVNSAYMKNEIKKLFNIEDESIFVIPNGIDIKRFLGVPCDTVLRSQYAKENEKLVFFVGRLVGEKGAHVLIDAIPKVLEHFGEVKVIIAGKGPEYEALVNRANDLRISDRVIFPGFIPEELLKKLYKCSDVAVFPSLYEPFGIVALEGMVARIPVIVSDVGGLNQLVEHRVTGMKFEAGNSAQLAECMVEIMTNSDLANKIVQNAEEMVNNFYRWSDIASRTIVVYKQALNSNRLD